MTSPARLVDIVRERILAGVVDDGGAVRQDALASELGVSKIPLREALTRLEQEGLLQAHANRGYFVRALTTAEAEEVYDLRIRLEPDAVAQAASHATEAERAHAIATFDALDARTHAHGAGVGAFNRRLHHALYAPCARPVTVSILDRLQVLSERYVRKHLEPLGRDARADEEHRALLETWLARDARTVHDLMLAHVVKTLADLRQQLAPPEEGSA